MSYPYPSEFPLDSINDLIAIIPTGDLFNEKAVNAYWTLSGYGLSIIKPVGPDSFPPSMKFAKSAEVVNSDEFVAALNEVKAQATEGPEGAKLVAAGKVPWGKIISFILQILPLVLAENEG